MSTSNRFVMAGESDYRTIADEARQLVADGVTDQAEADRVLGDARERE